MWEKVVYPPTCPNCRCAFPGPFDESDLALLNLAVEFKKKSLGFQMKAIVEGWSQEELVREMY
jgi:hypothetical protein